MPLKYYIDADINCVLVKHSDPFEMEKMNLQYQMIFKDPEFTGGTNILRDCGDAVLPANWNWERMTTTTKERMEAFNEKLGLCKLAWVVKDGTDFAKIHLYSVSDRFGHHGVERRTFRGIADTRQWLDIPDDYVINYPG
jgi:hypothetical protein